MSRARVFLHIGAPKTGTTYLQDRLARNARRLARHGVHYPGRSVFGDTSLFHFRAALDVLGADWGGPPGHADGAWEAMLRQVRRRGGTVVISHEILAPAPRERIRKVMADLAEHDVHVVYTARDLARQIPAGWQESIKQGSTWRFARYLRRVEAGGAWFMRAFDLPTVLDHWAEGLPPENVHVITVPGPDAPREELWHRFCSVVGIDPAWAPDDAERVNESMGIEETQVLRRLNRRLVAGQPERRRSKEADLLLLQMVQQGGFAGGKRRIELPPEHYPWAEAQAQRWVDWLAGSGVDVVGDLDDLRPAPPVPGAVWNDPDKPRRRQLARASIAALEAVTLEAARRPVPEQGMLPRVRAGFERLRSDR
ncbi:hypothetical protein NODU109028_09180 [Nocardioides dubius]|uniref:Sulfotransferase family protein n=1 Tax=Nocardioides dubius TaxID=317019 RepID=A0ABN1TVY8_9ACTN